MRLAARLCFLYWCGFGLGTSLLGAETESKLESARSTAATNTPPDGGASNVPRFTVRAYETKGEPLLPTDTQAAIFAKYLGTNISLPDIVKAASDLLLEYRQRGCPTASVAIAQERITNGIVTMNVFRGRFSQVLVSGHNYWGTNPASGGAQQFATALAAANTNKAASAATNASPRFAVRAYEIRGDTLLTDATLTSILVKYTGTNIGIEDIT